MVLGNDRIAVVLKGVCSETLKNMSLLGCTCVERMKKAVESAGFDFLGYSKDGVDNYGAVMEIDDCYPLLTKDDFIDICDYFLLSNESPIKFFAGSISLVKDYKERNNSAVFEKYFSTENAVKLTFETFGGIISVLQNGINLKHIKNGVLFIDKKSVYIDEDVEIANGTVIYPNCFIKGKTSIGKDCVIYGTTYIDNCKIFDNVNIVSSSLKDSVIKSNCSIGPFSYIRPNSEIGENCKIGDFVEIKNSIIKDNTKASHLAYVGDAEVGENCNIGCGVVFCNYDGKKKHKTIVKDNVFIGSNCNLIAPVEISDNSFIAAGTTVTDNVPQNAFCIGRSRQLNKEKKK